jgi:hypothetical protein
MDTVKMMRVQAVLAYAGMDPPCSFDDEWIFTACPGCGAAQSLGECPIRREGRETHYQCKNGCQDLVIVSPIAGGSAQPWPGRGYRFGEYVVRNAVDLVMVVGPRRLTLNASPAALLTEALRPASAFKESSAD